MKRRASFAGSKKSENIFVDIKGMEVMLPAVEGQKGPGGAAPFLCALLCKLASLRRRLAVCLWLAVLRMDFLRAVFLHLFTEFSLHSLQGSLIWQRLSVVTGIGSHC